jgi:hypothetical protein
MSRERYIVEGGGEPMGSVDAFTLSQLAQSGGLIGRQVLIAESGQPLSEGQVQSVIRSVQLPPPVLREPIHQGPVDGNQDPMRFVAPIHASGWAVAAGYLGLFSLVLVFAPFSIGAGLLALKDLKANPHKTGKGRAIFGLAMGIIFTILLIVILIGSLGK